MTITIAGDALIAYLMASVRIAAWLVLVPPFSSRSFPVAAKALLAFGLAFAVKPGMEVASTANNGYELIVTAITQVAIGVSMGFITYMLFAAFTAAGSMIDIFANFSAGQTFDPLSMNANSVFGKFYQQLATVLLFVTGGHLLVLGGLLKTFEFLPVSGTPSIDGFDDILKIAFAMFFTTAIQIALPLIAVLFISDLTLALLTKVAPQLNAINVMFPVKTGMAILLVGLALPALPAMIDRLVDLANEAMSTMVGAG